VKLRYLNGEKVYVDDRRSMGRCSGVSLERGQVGVCKHRDVIKALNSLFKRAEESPEERIPQDLWSLLFAMDRFGRKGGQKPLWEIMDEEAVFDDPGKVRLAKEARLRSEKRVNPQWAGRLHAIKGGQYKPIDPKIHDDALTDEFRAFLEKERICELSGNEAAK